MTSFCCLARTDGKGVSLDKLASVISEFNGRDGFEVVKIGRIGTSAFKTLTKFAALNEGDSEDAQAVIDLFGGIKKITIVDFDDCSKSDKDRFTRKVESLLQEDYLIMEMKDGGDQMKIYGVLDDKTDKINNFILYTPSECALICLFGTISLNSVSTLIGQ